MSQCYCMSPGIIATYGPRCTSKCRGQHLCESKSPCGRQHLQGEALQLSGAVTGNIRGASPALSQHLLGQWRSLQMEGRGVLWAPVAFTLNALLWHDCPVAAILSDCDLIDLCRVIFSRPRQLPSFPQPFGLKTVHQHEGPQLI